MLAHRVCNLAGKSRVVLLKEAPDGGEPSDGASIGLAGSMPFLAVVSSPKSLSSRRGSPPSIDGDSAFEQYLESPQSWAGSRPRVKKKEKGRDVAGRRLG